VKVRNDSGQDITFSVSGRALEWKQGESIDLTENEFRLLLGDTEIERATARQYWAGLFHGSLPRLIPQRGRVSKEDLHG
jgi:hypothetical protein